MKNATCKKCNATKPLSDFYKNQYSRVSGMGECSDCTKARVTANRFSKIDYYRSRDRERGNRQEVGYLKKFRDENPGKYRAQTAVNNAVRDGRIRKAECCEDCGSEFSLHGHHDDYSKPLDVRWLCAACHHQWHAKNGEAPNGKMTA